jgi:hypothetical protein
MRTLTFLSSFSFLLLISACKTKVVSMASGGAGGTGAATSTGTGATGGTGGATCKPACPSGKRCAIDPTTCSGTPTCLECKDGPFCGSDGKVYASDCAAAEVGVMGGDACQAPAGMVPCESYFCDATTEVCTNVGFFVSACVPCSTMGHVCGADGMVYDNQCALLAAGQSPGTTCQGFVACASNLACEASTQMCVCSELPDCSGGSPVPVCQVDTDGGL